MNGIKERVLNIVNWISGNHSFGCIYVGICDSVGGAPALEAILDYSKIIEDHNLTSSLLLSELLTLRVLAVSGQTEDFLGHDPTREPDAVSGVYQAEYIFNTTKGNKSDQHDSSSCSSSYCPLSENSTVSEWAESRGLEHRKVVRDSNGQRGNDIINMKGDFTSRTTSLLIFIFACFIAYLYQTYKDK